MSRPFFLVAMLIFTFLSCKKVENEQSEVRGIGAQVGKQLSRYVDDFLRAAKSNTPSQGSLDTLLNQMKNIDTEGRGVGRLLVDLLQDVKYGDDLFASLFSFTREIDGFSKVEFVNALHAAHKILDDAALAAKASGDARRIGFVLDNGVHVNGILEDILRNRSSLLDDITRISGKADEAQKSFAHLYLAMAWHDVGKVINLEAVPQVAEQIVKSPTLKEKPFLKPLALQMLHEEGSVHAVRQAMQEGSVPAKLGESIIANFRNHNDGSGHAGVWWNATMKMLWPDYVPELPKTMVGAVAALFDRFDQPLWSIVSRNPPQLGGGAVKISNVYDGMIQQGTPGKIRSVLEQGVAANVFSNYRAAQQGALSPGAIPLAGSIRQVAAMGSNGHPFGRLLRGMKKYRETLIAAKEMEALYKNFLRFSEDGGEVFIVWNGREVFRGTELADLHKFLVSNPQGGSLTYLEYFKREVSSQAAREADAIIMTLNRG